MKVWRKHCLVDLPVNKEWFYGFMFDNRLAVGNILHRVPWHFASPPVILQMVRTGIALLKE